MYYHLGTQLNGSVAGLPHHKTADNKEDSAVLVTCVTAQYSTSVTTWGNTDDRVEMTHRKEKKT